MELLQYWVIVRRWWHLILGLALVTVLSAAFFSWRTLPVYRATSVVLIQQATGNNVVVDYASVLTNERLASTYAQLLTTRPVLEETLKRLGLDAVLSADALKQQVRVTPVQNTSLLRISVEDTNPQWAVDLANTIPVVFSDYITSVQTERFQESKRSLQQQIQRLQTEISELQARIAVAQKAAGTGAVSSADILPLQTQLATLQSSYANLYKQYEEVRLAEARSQDTVVLTEPALYAARIRPQPVRNILMALAVGLMLGVGAAFLIEYLDDRIKTPDDIARVADVPVLTGIALVQAPESLPLVADKKPKSPASEAFRVLRTNIQFAGVDKPVQTLVVTSPGPEEGKSFVTSNLAVVMAQLEKRVIVIDSDLRRPMQHEIFGLDNNIGLTTALLDNPRADLSTYLQKPKLANGSELYVLTSGPIPANPSELLGSQRMTQLVKDLLSIADVLIFDSPPVLAVTDAAILSKTADGVLLVSRVNRTRLPAFYQSLIELDRVDARIIGVVLNSLPPGGGHYYSYYYYYPYQKYYTYYTDGQDAEAAQGTFPWRRKRRTSTSSSDQIQ